jgi:hypothetical protein
MKAIADLHIHTEGDPEDFFVKIKPSWVFSQANKHGINVLSFTHHDHIPYSRELAKEAKDKGILLIPGLEKTLYKENFIEGKRGKFHLLCYGTSAKVLQPLLDMQTEDELVRYKQKHKDKLFFCFAHPYLHYYRVPSKLLKRFVDSGIIDAIEYHGFYSHIPFLVLNDNKKAKQNAKDFGVSLLCNSDTHWKYMFGRSKSHVEVDKLSVVELFSKMRIPSSVEIFSKPHPLIYYVGGAILVYLAGVLEVILGRSLR